MKGFGLMIGSHRLARWADRIAIGAVLVLLGFGSSTTSAQSIRADHTTADASAIPQSALDAARALRMSFSHASVGSNIWYDGLVPLSSSDPGRYAFPNWTENARGNPGWEQKFALFSDWVRDHASEYDVFQNKLCYIDQDASFTAYRDSMLAIAQQHPTKRIIWWTMPLTVGGSDNDLRHAYNESVRSYCALHDLPLFDIADIESHRPNGSLVTSGGYPALAPEYASDSEGHLNSTGARRVASAFWYFMARLSGWTPEDGGGPTVDAGPAPRSGSSGCTVACRPDGAGAMVLAAVAAAFALLRRR